MTQSLLNNFSRRDLLKLSAAGALGTSSAGWFDALAGQAAASAIARSKAKSCILLWMGGGPAQTDTFDMKPGHENAGEFKPIQTNVSGIEICEHLPMMAKQADKLAILRGMSTGEADHFRGSYLMQSGYRSIAATSHPNFGSIASMELGDADFELPNFFWMGTAPAAGVGYLNARHSPFRIDNVREEMHQNIECVQPSGGYPVFDRRMSMLNHMEQGFQGRQLGAKVVADHRDIYTQAARMMRSSKLDAVDLRSEPKKVRESYGNSEFGKRCVLARRLIEVGVKFVGINSGLDWDTHNNNWSRMKPHFPIIDQAWSALLTDLENRGLLQDTLVIWMGEFGRDPKINNKNANAGREHYARAWTTVLSGAGIKTGQVIGRTSQDGSTVEERPISPIDYMATLSKILDIDDSKENSTPDGRPIRIVETGATPVAELF
ncbi:MAG: hypothetical protein ACI9HK_005392 [Pirellulaceae bacterium]|jgi:uncharacterized protein (DUF1501 family)